MSGFLWLPVFGENQKWFFFSSNDHSAASENPMDPTRAQFLLGLEGPGGSRILQFTVLVEFAVRKGSRNGTPADIESPLELPGRKLVLCLEENNCIQPSRQQLERNLIVPALSPFPAPGRKLAWAGLYYGESHKRHPITTRLQKRRKKKKV